MIFALPVRRLMMNKARDMDKAFFSLGSHPLFMPLTVAHSYQGLTGFFSGNNMEGLGLQMILTGFIVLNYLSVYGAIALRNDAGKMPTQIIIISTVVSVAL